jgi:hypothetical protein
MCADQLAMLFAQAVGDGTGVKPIYESLIDLKQLPYLEPHPHSLMRHITAVEAAGQPAVTFSRVERVGRILEVLLSTRHNGFAVISGTADGEQHIMGIVLRSQLVVLLRTRRCFQPTPFVSEVGVGHRPLPIGDCKLSATVYMLVIGCETVCEVEQCQHRGVLHKASLKVGCQPCFSSSADG